LSERDLERLVSVPGDEHLVARATQPGTDHRTGHAVVVGDEYARESTVVRHLRSIGSTDRPLDLSFCDVESLS
jgi:hypothetical protein